MSSNVTTDVDFFFMNPTTAPLIPGTFSQLYLLRRDIMTCFGINANGGQQFPSQQKALWPGVMGICAGIDLLGKFFAGNDDLGEVGKRYKDFLTTYFGVQQNEAEILYQLRNSLLHSFGLYSEVKKKDKVHVYKFVLTGNTGVLIIPKDQNTYIIDINLFRKNFETAIDAYEASIRHEANLQGNFANMMSKHGRIGIG